MLAILMIRSKDSDTERVEENEALISQNICQAEICDIIVSRTLELCSPSFYRKNLRRVSLKREAHGPRR